MLWKRKCWFLNRMSFVILLLFFLSGKNSWTWVYVVKLNLDGSLARLKVRLVVKGYSQVYVMDNQETFSPVAKQTSVRILLFDGHLSLAPLSVRC